ncbi:MAG: PaaI family thioesterase [Rikenellaceae bacterium]
MNFEEIYKNDIFANQTGIIIEELNQQHAKLSFTVEARHLNAGNVAHGGAIFTLCDIAMAAMANFKQPVSVSIQSDIRFLAVALEGDRLTAEAIEVFGRKKMYNCRVSVTNQNGELIAIAEGMFHTKNNLKM